MVNENKYIITLDRQFGSGGRKIGRKLAEMLGIEFYDKKDIIAAAKENGLSESLFDVIDEKASNSLLYSLVMGLQSDRLNMRRTGVVLNPDTVFRIQSQVIEELAMERSCVIVGLCSDYILRSNPNVINIFIHSSEEFKLERVMGIYKQTEKEALETMKKNDKKRANYYNFYTNREWDDVRNYHIAIDSSVLGIDDSAKILSDFVVSKFER